MRETLVGWVDKNTNDILESVGLSTNWTAAGEWVLGDFDRVEKIPNWDGNGTWSFYWKNGKTFLWNPGTDIFSECSETAYDHKREQIEAEKDYWKWLHEGERQWALSPVEKLQGWGLNNPNGSTREEWATFGVKSKQSARMLSSTTIAYSRNGFWSHSQCSVFVN